MRAWASGGSSELQVPSVGTLLMSGSGIRRMLQRFLHKWCIGRSFRVCSVGTICRCSRQRLPWACEQPHSLRTLPGIIRSYCSPRNHSLEKTKLRTDRSPITEEQLGLCPNNERLYGSARIWRATRKIIVAQKRYIHEGAA